jgi:hypothetical protein
MTVEKVTNQANTILPVVPTELYFDGIETTMMGAANSKLRFFVVKEEKGKPEEKQIATLPTLSLIQFCFSTLVKIKAMRTELENALKDEKDQIFQALEITDQIQINEDKMSLPSINKIGHFVGKLSKPKKLSIIDCDD